MYERFEDGEKIRHGTRGYRSIHIKRPNTGNVRFGSFSDIATRSWHFRFAAKSGHLAALLVRGRGFFLREG
jgi:hypothetical protein